MQSHVGQLKTLAIMGIAAALPNSAQAADEAIKAASIYSQTPLRESSIPRGSVGADINTRGASIYSSQVPLPFPQESVPQRFVQQSVQQSIQQSGAQLAEITGSKKIVVVPDSKTHLEHELVSLDYKATPGSFWRLTARLGETKVEAPSIAILNAESQTLKTLAFKDGQIQTIFEVPQAGKFTLQFLSNGIRIPQGSSSNADTQRVIEVVDVGYQFDRLASDKMPPLQIEGPAEVLTQQGLQQTEMPDLSRLYLPTLPLQPKVVSPVVSRVASPVGPLGVAESVDSLGNYSYQHGQVIIGGNGTFKSNGVTVTRQVNAGTVHAGPGSQVTIGGVVTGKK